MKNMDSKKNFIFPQRLSLNQKFSNYYLN